MSTEFRLPDIATLQHCIKLSVDQDKPIMMDYWLSSLETPKTTDSVFIGFRENQEKLLVKNAEEYTSPIAKIFKSKSEYIVMTENSIYIVDASIQTKKIS